MPMNDEWEPEPSLEDLLADPVVQSVMKADGLEAKDLIALVQMVSRSWRSAAEPQAKRPETRRRRA